MNSSCQIFVENERHLNFEGRKKVSIINIHQSIIGVLSFCFAHCWASHTIGVETSLSIAAINLKAKQLINHAYPNHSFLARLTTK